MVADDDAMAQWKVLMLKGKEHKRPIDILNVQLPKDQVLSIRYSDALDEAKKSENYTVLGMLYLALRSSNDKGYSFVKLRHPDMVSLTVSSNLITLDEYAHRSRARFLEGVGNALDAAASSLDEADSNLHPKKDK